MQVKLFCAVCLFILLCSSTMVYAQQTAPSTTDPSQTNEDTIQVEPNIPMHNVFYNALWGSLTGGLLYLGVNTVDNAKFQELDNLGHISYTFFVGATYGAILGVLTGFYLSMNGITFSVSNDRPVNDNLYLAENSFSALHSVNLVDRPARLLSPSRSIWHFHTTF